MCIFARDKTGRDVVRRNKRLAIWTFAIIFMGVVVMPLASYVYTAVSAAQAAAEKQTNPRANYWRAVRDGVTGYTAVQGPETNVLIQNGGQNWRQVRNGPVASIMPWVLAAVLGALLLWLIIRGQVKVESAPSGRTVARWNTAERVLHWYTAILFVLLAITGLSLLFGRAALIPVLGPAGFTAWATFAIYVHNYLSPFFIVGVVLEIIVWFRHNLPEKGDWEWIKQGGGYIGTGKHPHTGRINAGEKLFTFWIGLVVLGIAVSVTGLFLLGWIGSGMRETMQVANLIHAVAGVLWIALMLGHIYLGAWGVQGAFSAMWTGEVSEEWAKQHHDLWYDEAKKG
ncbi:MAG: formate dehydrogenase subunit gamma [Acidiferrobacterales bacterium]